MCDLISTLSPPPAPPPTFPPVLCPGLIILDPTHPSAKRTRLYVGIFPAPTPKKQTKNNNNKNKQKAKQKTTTSHTHTLYFYSRYILLIRKGRVGRTGITARVRGFLVKCLMCKVKRRRLQRVARATPPDPVRCGVSVT